MKWNLSRAIGAIGLSLLAGNMYASPAFHTVTFPIEITLSQPQVNIINAHDFHNPDYPKVRAGSELVSLFQGSNFRAGTYHLVNASNPPSPAAPSSVWVTINKPSSWLDDPGGTIKAIYTLDGYTIVGEVYLPHNINVSDDILFASGFTIKQSSDYFCNAYENENPDQEDINACAIFWRGDYAPY